ncbi:DoxX family protein [Stieleria sp. JC731]|uniref:DoxX family protein n=1 Tax=Pirellulaceae TaxID=2691357 RepID=UPI001E2AEC4E|nr:DoxX family protein [Stieleria sp. JC731]MCC9603308.1 DoxX family protein [Stieleria sp. JC731]
MTPSNPNAVRTAMIILRVALAASFLSAVADRFGIWGEVGTGSVAWGNFQNFLDYTALLLWYLPDSMVMIAGWSATIAEVVIAIGLLLGLGLRFFAYASAGLLATFAIAMTTATGAEAALSYSVWTAAAASLLLGSLATQDASPNEIQSHSTTDGSE